MRDIVIIWLGEYRRIKATYELIPDVQSFGSGYIGSPLESRAGVISKAQRRRTSAIHTDLLAKLYAGHFLE